MKKIVKGPDGREIETEIDAQGGLDLAGGEFRGEAPPDRSEGVASEVVNTVGAVIPPPTGTGDQEDHPERRPT